MTESAEVNSVSGVKLLEKNRAQIYRLWEEELLSLEDDKGADLVRHLKSQRRRKQDLLSQLSGIFAQKTSWENVAIDLLQKLRSHDFSSSDLVTEAFTLLRVLSRIEPSAAVPASWHDLHDRLERAVMAVCLEVLRETSDVYEHAVESSTRGFCQLDKTGRIIFANSELHRILKCKDLVGCPLGEFFAGEEKEFLEETFRGESGGQPRMRPLQLCRVHGEKLMVGVEILPFDHPRGRCAGVVTAVDISGPMRMQQQVFDASPLGILRIDLTGRIGYANPKIRETLQCRDPQGRHLKEFFDEANWEQIEKQLQNRFQRGLSNEYEAEILSFDSPRKKLPIGIAAAPERGMQGEIVGSLAIIRSLVLEKARERIHDHIETFSQSITFLSEVAREIATIMPYERLGVALYSSDFRHVRSLYETSEPESDSYQTRWWRMPDPVRRWLTNKKNVLIRDLENFLGQPRWQELRGDPAVQDLLVRDLQSIIRIPVFREKKLVASLSIFRRGKNAFTPEDVNLLKQLPLSKAVLMALYAEESRAQRFRLDLMHEIIVSCEDLEQVAGILVRRLVEFYGWQNASVFQVDEGSGRFRLVRQYAPRKDFLLPTNYSQPLGKGVLGWVHRHRRTVNICDVRTDPRFKDLFLRAYADSLSELCVPIGINEKLCWLLNMEDNRTNAFSQDEIDGLQVVVSEICEILKRAHLSHLLGATLGAASDAILVVDSRGRVMRDNPAVKRLLGYEKQALRGRSLRPLFARPCLFDDILAGARVAEENVALKAVDGSRVPVFLTASPLPVELGGAVLIAKDLSLPQRLEELEHLNRIYQEVALQTRPSLALASGWLRRLHARSPDPEAVEKADRVLRQLRKVELTYDRLALAGSEGAAVPEKVRLAPTEIVDRVFEGLPHAEQEMIDKKISPDLPVLSGDLYQLGFCLESILAYLMRFLPEGEQIGLRLTQERGKVVLRVEGFLPTRSVASAGDGEQAAHLSRTLMDMALGEPILRAFVANHGGTYHEPRRKGPRVAFRIDLPVEEKDVS